MTAYLELQYHRAEDNVPVTLVTELPRIRPLVIGGDPCELRLPGVPEDVVFGRIVPSARSYRLESAGSNSPLRLNGLPLPAAGATLEQFHTISVDDFRLTFHTG